MVNETTTQQVLQRKRKHLWRFFSSRYIYEGFIYLTRWEKENGVDKRNEMEKSE